MVLNIFLQVYSVIELFNFFLLLFHKRSINIKVSHFQIPPPFFFGHSLLYLQLFLVMILLQAMGSMYIL